MKMIGLILPRPVAISTFRGWRLAAR